MTLYIKHIINCMYYLMKLSSTVIHIMGKCLFTNKIELFIIQMNTLKPNPYNCSIYLIYL